MAVILVKENWISGERTTSAQLNDHGAQINTNTTSVSGAISVSNRAINDEIIASGWFQTNGGVLRNMDAVTITDGVDGDHYVVDLAFSQTGGTAGVCNVVLSGAGTSATNARNSDSQVTVYLGQDPGDKSKAYMVEQGVNNDGAEISNYASNTITTNWISGTHVITLQLNDGADTSAEAVWSVHRKRTVA